MKTVSFTFSAPAGFSDIEFTMDVKVASYVDDDRLHELANHLAKKLGVYHRTTQVEGGPSA